MNTVTQAATDKIAQVAENYSGDGLTNALIFGALYDGVMEGAQTAPKEEIIEYGLTLAAMLDPESTEQSTHPNVTAQILEDMRAIYRSRFGQPQPPATPPTSPFTGRPVLSRGHHDDALPPATAPGTPGAPVTIPEGTFTVVNPDGSYETIKIEEVKNEGSGLFGKIIASHISGPDNGTDFQGFAFVTEDGQVRVWKRFEGIDQRWVRAVLIVLRGSTEDRLDAREAYALRSSRCSRCGRKLTVPASIHRGMGPECATMGY